MEKKTCLYKSGTEKIRSDSNIIHLVSDLLHQRCLLFRLRKSCTYYLNYYCQLLADCKAFVKASHSQFKLH